MKKIKLNEELIEELCVEEGENERAFITVSRIVQYAISQNLKYKMKEIENYLGTHYSYCISDGIHQVY